MITYALDRHRLPIITAVADHRFGPLADWLITDISREPSILLDALAVIDDAMHGDEPEDWGSDNYEVAVTTDGFTVTNLYFPESVGRYALPEVRAALEEYWHFFLLAAPSRGLIREYRPDLPEWEAALLRWEERWHRRHPSRGRLF